MKENDNPPTLDKTKKANFYKENLIPPILIMNVVGLDVISLKILNLHVPAFQLDHES